MKSPFSLDEPLPIEAARRASGKFWAYQAFPAFSRPWLLKRTLAFGLGILAFGLLSGVSVGVAHESALNGLSVFLHFAAGTLVISSAGPVLATWIRYRRWTRSRERALVLTALIVGVLLSHAADDWASAGIERAIGEDSGPEPTGFGLVVGLALASVLYAMAGGGFAFFGYLDEPRALDALKRERELQALRERNHTLDMRLSVLQAQIEPHFLFNTLASLRSLIETDPAAATRVLDALVAYLRSTIPLLRGDAVDNTLGAQLRICRLYLDLMSVRTGRLSYEVSASEVLLEEPFPPLLLITLVENAIKHGIEPKPGHGHLTILAERKNSKLVVTVIDDGVGLAPVPGTGVGLENVREQLRLRYGNGASFNLIGQVRGGARAEIVIDHEKEPTA